MPSLALSNLRQRLGSRKLELALMGTLCLVAFLGAAWSSASVFERLPHTEDEAAFLFQAQTIASGRLIADAPEQPSFFSIPFIIIRDGMWFGKYPPGFPALLAVGVLAGQPWLVNATLAALCVLVIYLFSRYLFGTLTATLSAGLLVASPFFLLQSGALLSHLASLFWALLFLALFPLARSQRGLPLLFATGAAIGMLFLTRPLTAVGIALPYVIWSIVTMLRQRRIVRAYVLMAAGALPFLIAYLGYNTLTTGNPFDTAYELWWSFDRLGFGPEIGVNGHDLDDGLRNTRVNSTALASYLFGWPGRFSLVPALVAVLVSLLILVKRLLRWRSTRVRSLPNQASEESWDLILAGVVLSLMAVHILYWTPGQMYGPRYYMEAIGPLVILSARGFSRIADTLAVVLEAATPRARYPTAWANTLILATIVLLSGYAYLRWVPDTFDGFREWNGINGDGVEVVERANLENALILVARESWTDYAPFFAQNVPTLDSRVVYASDRGPRENHILIDLYPNRAIYRYADGQLTRIDPQATP